MNIVLAGPCGVGKSTVAISYAKKNSFVHLDFDAIGETDMRQRKGSVSPFSSSRLNFKECIPNLLSQITTGYILDIGGDTVFRANINNDERLEQVFWLKKAYSPKIIILSSKKDVLLKRFIATKNRGENEFNEVWRNWSSVIEPYWRRCGDEFIDTSSLTTKDVVSKLETIIKTQHMHG